MRLDRRAPAADPAGARILAGPAPRRTAAGEEPAEATAAFDRARIGWTNAMVRRLEPVAIGSLSLGAAAIHFGVTAEHFSEDAAFGVFFSTIGWFEALWAVAYVSQPARWLAILGMVASAGTVLIWSWAHLVGLPFGPTPGSVEPTTVTDLMATLFETILALWLAATLILSRRPGRRVSVRVGTIGVSALVLTIATGATIALAAAPMG